MNVEVCYRIRIAQPSFREIVQTVVAGRPLMWGWIVKRGLKAILCPEVILG